MKIRYLKPAVLGEDLDEAAPTEGAASTAPRVDKPIRRHARTTSPAVSAPAVRPPKATATHATK